MSNKVKIEASELDRMARCAQIYFANTDEYNLVFRALGLTCTILGTVLLGWIFIHAHLFWTSLILIIPAVYAVELLQRLAVNGYRYWLDKKYFEKNFKNITKFIDADWLAGINFEKFLISSSKETHAPEWITIFVIDGVVLIHNNFLEKFKNVCPANELLVQISADFNRIRTLREAETEMADSYKMLDA